MDAEVCLAHTYDQWTTSTGLALRIGCGLTANHFNRALGFVEFGAGETDECAIVKDIPFVRSVTAPAPVYHLGEDEAFAAAVSRI
jgi:hypothetical protein